MKEHSTNQCQTTDSGYQSVLDDETDELCIAFSNLKSPSHGTHSQPNSAVVSSSENIAKNPSVSKTVTFDDSLPVIMECVSDDDQWETETELSDSDDENDEDYFPMIDPDSLRDSSDSESETSDSENEGSDLENGTSDSENEGSDLENGTSDSESKNSEEASGSDHAKVNTVTKTDFLDYLKIYPGFSLCFDNTQIKVTRRHHTKENQNDMIMMTNAFGVPNRVVAKNDGDQTLWASDISPDEFFINQSERKMILDRCTVICTRIIVRHLPHFTSYRDCVKWHILHDHSDEMARKSDVVSCYLQFIYFHYNQLAG